MSEITIEHKLRYLRILHHNMSRIVSETPDINQDKGRMSGDVKIVESIIRDYEKGK